MKPVPEPVTTPIQSRSDTSVPVQLAIDTRRGVLPSVKISAFTLIAPETKKVYYYFAISILFCLNLPYCERPSCLQTTEASISVQGV